MSQTTGRRIRIQTGDNPEGKKRIGLNPAYGGRITVDDHDISNHVTAIDIHLDAKSIPTARIETIGLELDIEAELVQTQDPTPLDAAYTERAHLVALLAQLYPSGWDYADPSTPDWPIVFIDLPTGQATWHVSPNDWWIFACVPRRHGATWDGHTTEQKYQRIRDLIAETEKNHPEHTSRIIEGELITAGTAPQLCATCYGETQLGHREHANPAVITLGGQTFCGEHVQAQAGPALPGRTPGGIILGNGS